MMAHIGEENMPASYPRDLFDAPHLSSIWSHLMGMEAHNAFECVGSCQETRIALRMCIRRGMKGAVLDAFLKNFSMDAEPGDDTFKQVHAEASVPLEVFEQFRTFLEADEHPAAALGKVDSSAKEEHAQLSLTE
jgi:UDP-N-acetyl-alpha-D-muramoyl-L-alanyl-L-glutamate epimerase